MPETSVSYAAPTSAGFDATVELPGSKSLTNRELVLSALASEPSELIDPLISRDTKLMIEALEKLGARFESSGDSLRVTPGTGNQDTSIDCGLAGTVMRFVPPVAALATGRIEFDGDAAARRRPMITTIDSLESLGVRVEHERKALPFAVIGSGEIPGGDLEIDASASSQSAARFQAGLTLSHSGPTLPSMPHIEMALATLNCRCVSAIQTSATSWRVEPGEIAGATVKIEPDLSNAGPFLAAALVTGGTVRIPNWPSETTQVGADFVRLLGEMGAEVSLSQGTLTLTGTGTINGIDADLSAAGELTPTIAAIAALASTPSRLTGIAHLRGHETDRIAALVAEINSLGGVATELEDGIAISPGNLSGGTWHSYEDHRMATAGAILGLVIQGVVVDDIATTSK
ncbi:MAG: 3-phosphoshikimate 1-carboxyvinyltransferase, partial [Aquiluna sp.]